MSRPEKDQAASVVYVMREDVPLWLMQESPDPWTTPITMPPRVLARYRAWQQETAALDLWFQETVDKQGGPARSPLVDHSEDA